MKTYRCVLDELRAHRVTIMVQAETAEDAAILAKGYEGDVEEDQDIGGYEVRSVDVEEIT